MLQKVIKNLIVIGSLCIILGCGGVTALSALGTAGSAAATKVIEHTAGYGIQSPHTIIEKVMPTVVTVTVEIQQPVQDDVRRFIKPGEPMGPPQPQVEPFSAGSGFVVHETGAVSYTHLTLPTKA